MDTFAVQEKVRNTLSSQPWMRAARLTWVGLAVLAFGVFIVSLPAYVLNIGKGPPDVVASVTSSAGFVFAVDVIIALASITAALVSLSLAVVLYRRKPGDGMALFVSFYLFLYGIVLAGPLEELEAYWPGLYKEVGMALAIVFSMTYMLFLLFPNGRFVPRWTRWLVPLFILGLPGLYLTPPYVSEESINPLIRNVTNAMWFGLTGVTLYAQIYRYRHVSSTLERQQIKWVVFGFALWFTLLVLTTSTYIPRQLLPPEAPIPWWVPIGELLWFIALSILPISLSIAVLRYRLWDIGIVVNRTLVYGALTAITMGIYVFIVGYVGDMLQAQNRSMIAFLTTGLVAVLFQPLREHLQRFINRFMYGDRDDPVSVISKLGERLEATGTPEAVLPGLVETVAQTLKLPYAAIELEERDSHEVAAAFGLPVDQPVRYPLVYQAETVGYLIVAPRSQGETFSSADQDLLQNIAHQAGPVAHNVRLTSDLRRSRRHLVTAREEERRRLRRDLHDGLGPQLASQALTLEAIEKLLEQDPEKAVELVKDLKAQSQAAVHDIRSLIYELRPPVLDDLGLVEALREIVTRYKHNGLQVIINVQPKPLPHLPAAVELAAYRIAQESLNNVFKHAEARTCELQLALENAVDQSGLNVQVVDDGRGLPPDLQPGVGLHSMRERAEELGGHIQFVSRPIGGTRVSAWLPFLAHDLGMEK